jgi:F-type H+-transporting ATPase subunit b
MNSRSTLRISRKLARPVLAILFGLMLFAVVPASPALRLNAQESQPAGGDTARPAAGGTEATSREAGKTEAKEADENEALKNAPLVRWIARVTGLSLNRAYWLCVLINFGIVFCAVAWGLRKKLPGMFKDRTRTIQSGIEEARKSSEEARRRLTEVEGRLARLDVEITEMRREAQENAAIEEKRIVAETEQERRRIVASAEQEIALAAASARRELKSYAAGLAVDLAAKKIHVGKDTDEALVREFTAHVGKDGN